MAKNGYMLSGTMTPVDINSEEFKEKCKKYSETRKRGHTILTNSKKYANITVEELDKLFKNGCIVSIDIDFSDR